MVYNYVENALELEIRALQFPQSGNESEAGHDMALFTVISIRESVSLADVPGWMTGWLEQNGRKDEECAGIIKLERNVHIQGNRHKIIPVYCGNYSSHNPTCDIITKRTEQHPMKKYNSSPHPVLVQCQTNNDPINCSTVAFHLI